MRKKATKLKSAPILPRQDKELNDKQDRFVQIYLINFDREEAVTGAGYKCKDYASIHETACRLLKHPKIKAIVHDAKAKFAAQCHLTKEKWVEYLRLVVVEATMDKDWIGAVAALRELGRHLGVYEIDNRQRMYSGEDVARMREELERMGMNFTRTHAPAHLQRPAMIVRPNEAPTDSEKGTPK